MHVSQILREKGNTVFTTTPDETVSLAAVVLHDNNVGALVVVDRKGAVVGIFSERDVIRSIALHGPDGLAGPVADCMTRDVIFAEPQETVNTLMGRMTNRRVRHLPVLTDGKLSGLVSIGDLVKHKIAETEAEAETLKAYIAA